MTLYHKILEDVFSVISTQVFMAIFYICHFINFEALNRIFYIEYLIICI
jgi:hypothetical protein